jgi:signal transduction histidine kinase
MSRILPRALITLQMAVAFCGQSLSAYSQHNYTIKHYTNENGLPANGIKGIELDKKSGFLWVGTQGGLVRFDGRHFTSFTAGPNSRTALMTRNREGAIFFGDNNYSVKRINGDRPVFVLTDTFFLAPFRPRNGGYGIQPPEKVAEKLRSLKPSAFLPPWVVYRDEHSDSSSFSFVQAGQQVYHYQASSNKLLSFPGFVALAKLNKETYFVRSSLEIAWYNDSLGKAIPVHLYDLPNGNDWGKRKPPFIWMPGMDAPLIIDQGDIWKLTGKNDSLRPEMVCQDCCPPNSNITCAQIWEEQGILFLGSETNGLYVVQTSFIRPVRADPTIEAGKEEYAQVEATPGMVTTASGLSFSTQGELIAAKAGFAFPRSNVYQDRQGDCWFSTIDSVCHFHRRDGTVTKISINTWATKTVFAEMDERMYVIFDLAIGEITGDRYRPLYKLPDSVNDPKGFLGPDAAIGWKPGVLAIAAEKLLLFHRNRPTVLDTIVIPGVTTKIRALYKHGDYLLIGTYGQGFYMYKDGVVKKMPADKNGYLSYAHCFMPDEKGYCWISTNHGLFKVSLQALTTAWEKDLPEIYYHYFGKEDGIVNTEFNGGCQPCAIKLSNGLFSFPTMNGMALLDPLRPHNPPPGGQIIVDEVRIDAGLHQPDDDHLQSLPYNARNLLFRLALPHYGNGENIYFSYKLEPYNDEWETQDIVQNNTIQFGGLKPGSYTLYLRVRNGFGTDQFGISAIRFRILKPWYQSWWFYVVCLLGFVALTWGLVRLRTAQINKRKKALQVLVDQQTENIAQQSGQLESQLQQLQQQQVMLEEDNNIKARLIGIISHDMISPLKFMNYMSNKLREGFSSSDPAYHTAGLIATVAQDLESLSVNMLSWIRFHHGSVAMTPEKFNLFELVNESVEIGSVIAKEKGIQFYNEVPVHLEIFQQRQLLGVIVYNLAMNAVKYTAAGTIRITSQHTHDHLSLSVIDTGAGMAPELVKRLNDAEPVVSGYSTGETKKYQFGYIIIKDLLRLVQGRLKVESIVTKGTRVTIELLLPEVDQVDAR